MSEVQTSQGRPRRRLEALAIPVAIVVSALIGERPACGQIACSYDVLAVIQGPNGPLHESPTFPTAISPNGQHVVGWYRYDSVGPDLPWYWSEATGFVGLPLPPDFTQATPEDINNNRVLCGSGWQNGLRRAFVYDMNAGLFTVIPPQPTGLWSGAAAINQANDVVGWRSIGPGPAPETAYIWSNGIVTDLGIMNGPNSRALGISDSGIVVGFSGSTSASDDAIAFVHQDGTTNLLAPVPDGFNSVGWAATSDGRIVVSGRVGIPGNSVVRTFILDERSWTHLLPLAGDTYTVAADISEAGLVAGVSRTITGLPGGPIDHGALWLGSTAVALVDRVELPSGVELEGPIGISNNGRIAVIGLLKGDRAAVVLAPLASVVGDTNCDSIVNVTDLLNVITHWGPCTACSGDLTNDSVVDVNDLLLVITNWDP